MKPILFRNEISTSSSLLPTGNNFADRGTQDFLDL